jgi:hypothetical protein
MDELTRAGAALAGVLERENAALAAFNLADAAGLLADKRVAAEALAGAQARAAASATAAGGTAAGGTAAGGTAAVSRTGLPELAERLRGLAAENRRLLERAIAVQGRVLEVFALAAPRASALAPRYGMRGALVGRERALPVAVTASA